jgi:hypothetical protein
MKGNFATPCRINHSDTQYICRTFDELISFSIGPQEANPTILDKERRREFRD